MMPDRDAEKLARQWIAIQRAGNFVGLSQQRFVESIFKDVRKALGEKATVLQIANSVAKLIKDLSPIAYSALVDDLTKVASLTATNAQQQVAAIGKGAAGGRRPAAAVGGRGRSGGRRW